MDMGEKIKSLRLQKGMTLEELGEKVGVGKSTVRKWENGIIANMRRDKIAKIADALETSPAYLMGWAVNLQDDVLSPESAILSAKVAKSPELKELVSIYLSMNETGRKRLIDNAFDLSQVYSDKRDI